MDVPLTTLRALFGIVLLMIAAYAAWSTFEGWHHSPRHGAARAPPAPRPKRKEEQVSNAVCDQVLTFTTPHGDEVAWTVAVEADEPHDGGRGFAFRSRHVTVSAGEQRILQRRLTGTGSTDERDAWERRLDAEICAGLRLVRRFGERNLLPVLPPIVGYKVDVDEPFVLWQPRRACR
ncbi:hypothetical protein [Dactylosporangium darangshiense]|uniref:hypothetical protein n=1 Tax=Dactylosporangium darangshiense TaxID=579108 RepID=UPI0036263E55